MAVVKRKNRRNLESLGILAKKRYRNRIRWCHKLYERRTDLHEVITRHEFTKDRLSTMRSNLVVRRG